MQKFIAFLLAACLGFGQVGLHAAPNDEQFKKDLPAAKERPTFVSEAANEDNDPEVVQEYEPAPAIWLLEDEDTKIYMFGTFHVLPRKFRWRTDTFDAVVASVDELVVESSDDEFDAKTEAWAMKLVADSLTRQPTSERLTADAAEKWFKIAELGDMPQEFFDKLPPFMAILSVGIQLMEQQGSRHDYGVETILEAEFAAAGKPIGSIEDAIQVLDNLLAIDEALLLSELEQELLVWDGENLDTLGLGLQDQGNEGIDPFASEHLWAQGKTETLGELGLGETPYERQLEKVLLEDRNRAWTLWLEERLDRPGSILLAVGAAHLAGDLSVQSMLEERGFEVKRVQ